MFRFQTRSGEEVVTHEIAAFAYAARPAVVERDGLTVAAIEARFQAFLAEHSARIITAHDDGALIGLLILAIRKSQALEMNPGRILGGHPVLAPDYDVKDIRNGLIREATTLAMREGFSEIKLVTSIEDSGNGYSSLYEGHGFVLMLHYVEMICRLDRQTLAGRPWPKGFDVQPLSQASREDVRRCYLDAFSNGDAQFFFHQAEEERRAYFDTLGYEDALQEPLSTILLLDQQLVGFALVLPYGEGNCHISCMCIESAYRRLGLGEMLLQLIMRQAPQRGYKTITLGTEPEMGAYHLYKKNGFTVTTGSTIWRWSA